ncbi:MAG: GHKL domain-containing protein [Firmicutes bacterium]|nr:GHKL domain-containing protein [Bacillota bacterium]
MNAYKKLTLFLSWLILTALLITAGYKNFTLQRDRIIEQQSDQLLIFADNVSNSLNRYFDEHSDALWLLSQSDMLNEALFEKYLLYKEHEILEISLLNVTGDEIFAARENHTQTKLTQKDVYQVLSTKKGLTTTAQYLSEGRFIIKQLQPVIQNNTVIGILVQTIDLNKVYTKLVDYIKPGEYGYVLVKSTDGIIIMHPVLDQIGSNSLIDRKALYPEDDWTELETLFNKQISEKRGTHVYHSKWWQGSRAQWTKKVTAFTTYHLDENEWIISVQMDYDEIETPIRDALINTLAISGIVLILISAIIAIILISDKKQRLLALEAKYHRELSESWQALINSEARLRHAQKLETIGTLTSGIAHEFNNLLTPILGHSEIIIGDLDPQDVHYEGLNEIHQTAVDAQTIIEQLQSYIRGEEISQDYTGFQLKKTVDDSIKLLRPIIPSRVKLMVNSSDYAPVYGIQKQIQQVIINLITNAVHAIGQREGSIQIDISTEDAYTLCIVRDNGGGIPEETLAKIFEPFFTTKSATNGSGLGLYIVKSIIEAHGGTITVQSEVGVGSDFIIRLPILNES